MTTNKICEKCGHEIIPDEWALSGWGDGPHCGLSICSCGVGKGFPALMEGDVIVDRNYTAMPVKHTTYGYNGKNIMSVQRINSYGYWVVIWSRDQYVLSTNTIDNAPKIEVLKA